MSKYYTWYHTPGYPSTPAQLKTSSDDEARRWCPGPVVKVSDDVAKRYELALNELLSAEEAIFGGKRIDDE